MQTRDDETAGAQARRFTRIVIMGPSGCGKSTLGRALADSLGWRFVEGDDFHSPHNKAKMARGEPLTDADRIPFLDGVGEALADAPHGVVASCSALRRAYRDRLRALAGPLFFVLPEVPREELLRRLEERPNSFMPPSLIDSQLATLETLEDDEAGMTIDGTRPVASEIARVRESLIAD
jgi:carbohydrate kinase (thermoresistant glucokinase family)